MSPSLSEDCTLACLSIQKWPVLVALSLKNLFSWSPLLFLCLLSGPYLSHPQTLSWAVSQGRDWNTTLPSFVSILFPYPFIFLNIQGERGLVRWKPLLGKGKKEIACERGGGGRRGRQSLPLLCSSANLWLSFSTRPFKVGRLSGSAVLAGQ